MAFETKRKPERSILVGLLERPRRRRTGNTAVPNGLSLANGPKPTGASLEELALLAKTAGSDVRDQLLQRREAIRPATFLSRGKLEQLAALCEEADADLVIFDEDLSPAQGRNLEKYLERKVIDRTELILDIFATRARTREAQLQVELAQLQYMLPRLTGLWKHLSRQVGGIGTRGPGETQLEVDRRRVRQRISILKRRLTAVERERATQSRQRKAMFRACLVGYTNAGKSTLFNTLTRAGVLEEDRLFATLETTTRRLSIGPDQTVLLSDTVGFIRKLPHHLVASFRATLGEVREADCLIHVVDGSHPGFHQQMTAVDEVVEKLLEKREVSRLVILNKADLLTPEERLGRRAEFPDALLMSAREREQAEALRGRLVDICRENHRCQERPAAEEESTRQEEPPRG